jgi:hypothetical protein
MMARGATPPRFPWVQGLGRGVTGCNRRRGVWQVRLLQGRSDVVRHGGLHEIPQRPERLCGATGGKEHSFQPMVLQHSGRAIALRTRACSIQDETGVFRQWWWRIGISGDFLRRSSKQSTSWVGCLPSSCQGFQVQPSGIPSNPMSRASPWRRHAPSPFPVALPFPVVPCCFPSYIRPASSTPGHKKMARRDPSWPAMVRPRPGA